MGLNILFDCLQLLGGVVLSVGYIPQILQIIKTKSVKDLNFNFLCMVFIGVSLMESNALFMVLVKNVGASFLITNTIALMLCGTLLFLFLLYEGGR